MDEREQILLAKEMATNPKPQHLPTMPLECLNAFLEISKVGAAKGYTYDSWTKESILHHVAKAVGHTAKWMDYSTEEDHLLHAMWRICAAVALLQRKRVKNNKDEIVSLCISSWNPIGEEKK